MYIVHHRKKINNTVHGNRSSPAGGRAGAWRKESPADACLHDPPDRCSTWCRYASLIASATKLSISLVALLNWVAVATVEGWVLNCGGFSP